jgi:hypothetical protein
MVGRAQSQSFRTVRLGCTKRTILMHEKKYRPHPGACDVAFHDHLGTFDAASDAHVGTFDAASHTHLGAFDATSILGPLPPPVMPPPMPMLFLEAMTRRAFAEISPIRISSGLRRTQHSVQNALHSFQCEAFSTPRYLRYIVSKRGRSSGASGCVRRNHADIRIG